MRKYLAWLLLALCAGSPALLAAPQQAQLDAAVVTQGVQGVLQRAPDAAVDDLFRAVHTLARDPQNARHLCAVFDPEADRSPAGWSALADRLDPAHQQRLLQALGGVLVAGLQNPSPQPLDQAAAMQALKANGARAGFLYDGFSAGMAPDAPPAARCRSLGWMLDVLKTRPLPERAQVVRLLMLQGLNEALAAQAGAGGS